MSTGWLSYHRMIIILYVHACVHVCVYVVCVYVVCVYVVCVRACVRVCVYLLITGEANVKLLTISVMGVVQVGLRVPTPSPWDMVLAPPPQVDLPALAHSAWLVSRHSSASLGRCNHLAAARDFAFVCLCALHAYIKRGRVHHTYSVICNG